MEKIEINPIAISVNNHKGVENETSAPNLNQLDAFSTQQPAQSNGFAEGLPLQVKLYANYFGGVSYSDISSGSETTVKFGPKMLDRINRGDISLLDAGAKTLARYFVASNAIEPHTVASETEKEAFKKYYADQSVTAKEFFSEEVVNWDSEQDPAPTCPMIGALGRALTNPWVQEQVDSGAISMTVLKEKSSAELYLLSNHRTPNSK